MKEKFITEDFYPFDENFIIPDREYDAVWIIEKDFENGRGYFLTEPKLISIARAKEVREYRNVYLYPAYKKKHEQENIT